jgi:hypothetical protein
VSSGRTCCCCLAGTRGEAVSYRLGVCMLFTRACQPDHTGAFVLGVSLPAVPWCMMPLCDDCLPACAKCCPLQVPVLCCTYEQPPCRSRASHTTCCVGTPSATPFVSRTLLRDEEWHTHKGRSPPGFLQAAARTGGGGRGVNTPHSIDALPALLALHFLLLTGFKGCWCCLLLSQQV